MNIGKWVVVSALNDNIEKYFDSEQEAERYARRNEYLIILRSEDYETGRYVDPHDPDGLLEELFDDII